MRSPSRPDYDVAVVGASSAGLVAARRTAAAGMRTLVVDSRPSFEEPARTWIVTRKIEDLVGCDVGPSVLHETGTMELRSEESRVRVGIRPADLIVERSLLRSILARAAETAGAHIQLGRRVGRVEEGGGHFVLRLGGRNDGAPTRVAVRHVIGADGVKSVVAESMGAAPQRVVPIVQARVPLPPGHDPDVTKVWFDRVRTRFFYWLIPESPDHGVLGLIAERPGEARRLLDGFVEERGFRKEGYQGAMIPLHRPGRRIEWRIDGGRVLLVGDAAAHVKVTTVGGVVSGMWGATAAARALVEGTPYRRELRPLHRELYLHDLVRWIMDRFHDRHYDRLLEMLNVRLQRLLSHHNRDSYAPAAWALLRAQPRVVSLALDVLVRPGRPDRAPDE